MVSADKTSCYSHNRSTLGSNQLKKCSKTLKQPGRSALRSNESWRGRWMMFVAQGWSRMVYYSHFSMFLGPFHWLWLTQIFQTGEGHLADAFACSHTVHSSNFFNRSTTSFWPKHRRHRPVVIPTHVATSRMNPRPVGSTGLHFRKQCTPSHRRPCGDNQDWLEGTTPSPVQGWTLDTQVANSSRIPLWRGIGDQASAANRKQ